MKKQIKMRKIIFFVILTTILAQLSSCKIEQLNDSAHIDISTLGEAQTIKENDYKTDQTDSHGTDTVKYSLVRIGENNYMVFDNISKYNSASRNELATLTFKSVKEFKDSVTKGELKDWQKEVIATAFPKDGDKVLTCDFDHLLVPVMPDDIQIDSVGWSGESYSFSFIIPDGAFGIMYVYPENQFDRVYSSRYEDFFKNDLIHINQTKQKDDGKTETYYSTSAGNFMQARYSLTGEGKTVIVDKTYRLYMNDLSLKCSDTVPSEVRLYFFEDGVKYIYDFFELVEDITDDFIIELGIEEYAE